MRVYEIRQIITLLVFSLACLTSSCGRQQPTAPTTRLTTALRGSSTIPSRVAAEGTLEGDIGPGAHYVISTPEAWNGDLVLYAHGYTAPLFMLGIPPGEEVLVEGVRTLALQSGFAFAYSSYSQTGLGVKDAMQRTDQLLGIFNSRVGRPTRVFLVGTSFGGLVALKLVEERPRDFAGVLTLCGMLGGIKAEIDYASHVRVLFDYFFHDVLPGNLYEMPEISSLEQLQQIIIGPATDALTANPQAAGALALLVQPPIPLGPATGAFIVQALVLHALEVHDLLDRTHGQGFFDNTQTVYTADLPPELLADVNAHVERYSAGPAAIRLFQKYYEPTGDLQVPLVSLHTSLDPVVPIFHESIYRSRVEERGQLENLHQTTIDRFGHCNFTPEEIAGAFQQLVALAPAPTIP
jgi:pimeloyl-ACP methyl ester carboxylesterase